MKFVIGVLLGAMMAALIAVIVSRIEREDERLPNVEPPEEYQPKVTFIPYWQEDSFWNTTKDPLGGWTTYTIKTGNESSS